MARNISVNIVGDASQFRASANQATQSLRQLEGVSRQSQATISKWDKTFGAFSRGLVALAGVTLVARQLSQLTQSAEAAATANARLAQVFESMGDSTGKAAADAQNLARELSRSTGIEANTIKLAQAKLATFRDVSSETARLSGIYDRATKAAADLSATGFGEMSSVATQLGRALQDPIAGLTALRRAGVTFTEEQRTLIATLVESGRTLEAQRVILGAIENQVGGVAEATANASDKMRVAIEESKVAIGDALLPVLAGTSRAAQILASALGAIPAPVITGVVAIGGLIIAKKLLTATLLRANAALLAYELRAQKAAAGTSLLGVAAGSAALKMSAFTKAIGIGAVAFIGWEQASGRANDSLRRQVATSEEITDAVTRQGKAVKDLTIDLSNWGLATPLIDDQLESWEALRNVFDQTVWEKGKNILGEIFSLGKGEGTVERTAALEWLRNVETTLAGLPVEEARAQWSGLIAKFEESGASARAVAEANEFMARALRSTESPAQAAARSIQEVSEAYKEAKKPIDDFLAAVLSLTDPFFRQQKATADYISLLQSMSASLDDVIAGNVAAADVIDTATGAFNLSTDAGRKADAAARDLTQTTFELVAASLLNGSSQETVAAKVAFAREAFIAQATQMGLNATQAAALADQYGLIPDRVETSFIANTAEAQNRVRDLKLFIDQIQSKSITIDVFQRVIGPGVSPDAIERNLRNNYGLSQGQGMEGVTAQGVTAWRVTPQASPSVTLLVDGASIPVRSASTRTGRQIAAAAI